MNIINDIINSYRTNIFDAKNFEYRIESLKHKSSLEDRDSGFINLQPFGKINFPYIELGKVKSSDLINLYEITLFAYYWSSKDKYKKVADVGSNIGLHSIVLKKSGFKVTSYEPDIETSVILKNNLNKNDITDVDIVNKAVSGFNGIAEFIKIKDNLTGSHISGSKQTIYGDVKKFNVECISLSNLCEDFDLIKLDIEGAEDQSILSLSYKDLQKCDILVEIHSLEKSKKIYQHLKDNKINCFAQKNLWKKVKNMEEMPKNYKEGALFISSKEKMSCS
jgi:FkbM family methyltransferase